MELYVKVLGSASSVLDGPCPEHATCTQGPLANYTCSCPAGFTDNLPDRCSDINECETGSVTCDPNAQCVNLPGTARCVCNDGYFGDGTTCEVNECEQPDTCHEHATCTKFTGGFSCSCNSGYTGNSTHCADENECLADPCLTDAVCVNTDGSFYCVCRNGLDGDGITDCSGAQRERERERDSVCE